MSLLYELHCETDSVEKDAVTKKEIAEWKAQIPAWDIIKEDGARRLYREFTFDNFSDALDFTDDVGDAAEEEGHHPVLVTEWGKVTVSWWTHEIGGLHKNDFIMAAKTDELYETD